MSFSAKTIAFLKCASRQKHPLWLERNREKYEAVLRQPLTELALHLKSTVSPLAPDYHFPTQGLGRMKRGANWVAQRGGGLYKDWMTYAAARPRVSRFEHNPNLFFLINSKDKDDPILVAGGLYMPSSRQTRTLREAFATDTRAFEELFKNKEFTKSFKGGFSKERIATRPPRGFDPQHPKLDWLKLQAFFVWRPYSKREFYSPRFSSIVEKDWKQILKLNRLLELALKKQLPTYYPKKKTALNILDHLAELPELRPELDF